MPTTPPPPTLGHVALTVSDLPRSVDWYQRLLGVDPVLDEDTGPFRHVVFALGDTLLGLHAFPDVVTDVAFDERRVGLDHVSLAVADRPALEAWQARLEELGITHGGIVDASYGTGLSFRDPDGIALELFTAPS